MKHRPERVSSLIKQILSLILLKEVEIDSVLITLTDVEIKNKDLQLAKVKVSVIPTGRSKDVLKLLKSRQGYLQHLLNEKMNIKPMPRIEFEIDYGMEKAAGVEKALMEK